MASIDDLNTAAAGISTTLAALDSAYSTAFTKFQTNAGSLTTTETEQLATQFVAAAQSIEGLANECNNLVNNLSGVMAVLNQINSALP
jgi:hypothetical protein